MTSTVTNFSQQINTNYPIPGVDNDTQGFRDNFINIKQALNVAANEITEIKFASTRQENITAVGTLTNLSIENDLNIGPANIKYSNNGLIFSGISNLTIETTATISAVLSNWSGNIGPIGTLSTLTFISIDGINIGDTFKLWPGETGTHIVNNLNLANKTVTTNPFSPIDALNAGVGDGSSVIFNIGVPYGSLYYAGFEPATPAGRVGDRKGGIFATEDKIYISTKDYDTSNIWVSTPSNSLVSSLQSAVSSLQSTSSSLISSVGNLQSSVSSLQSTVSTLSATINLLQESKFRSTEPFSSSGAPGDRKGMIYANTTTFFVCFQDYVGSTSPIWLRFTGGATNW
jgi:hypothetical protein